MPQDCASPAIALTPPQSTASAWSSVSSRAKEKRSLRDALAEAPEDPACLVASREAQGLALPGDFPGRHITKARLRASADSPPCCKIPKPITPHSLRHAFRGSLAGTKAPTSAPFNSCSPSQPSDHIKISPHCDQQSLLHSSPLDLLPRPVSMEVKPTPPNTSNRRARWIARS